MGGQVKVKEYKSGRFVNIYKNVLNWVLSYKWIMFIIVVLMFFGSLFFVLLIGVSYLLFEEEKMMQFIYSLELGEMKKEVEVEVEKVEKILFDCKYVDMVQYLLGFGSLFVGGDLNGVLFYIKYESDMFDFDKEKDNVLKKI